MFSIVTSAFFSISLTSSSPRGDLRSTVRDFLFALNMWKYHGSSGALPGRTRRAGSPVFGFSIFTTSAPSHERSGRRERKARVRRVHGEPDGPAEHRPVFAAPAHAGDGTEARSAAASAP